MIAIKTNVVEDAINVFRSKIEEQRRNALDKLTVLQRDFASSFQQVEKDYLNKVIACFLSSDIITGEPSFLDETTRNIGVVPDTQINSRSFHWRITKCIGYDDLRGTFYPEYFQKLGIKTCVYCNSQLAVSAEKKRGGLSAKFQVDHYRPKSEYPFLSISLYNLYPTCAACNLAKRKKHVNFNLYEDTIAQSRYKFMLEKGSVANYLLTRNVNNIKFTFVDPDASNTSSVTDSFLETFDIQGIYDTQKDIIEEMIIKAAIYDDFYKKTLIDSFPHLFSKHGLYNRFILGNYDAPEDIHKRPMAKFMQDIARSDELKLI